MATKSFRRSKESKLYELLMESYFEIMGTTPIKLKKMYSLVKDSCPDLCDDSYINSRRTNEPEWHHIIKLVRNVLRNRGLAIRTENYSEWMFFPRS